MSRRTLAFVLMVSAILGVWIWREAGKGPGPQQSQAEMESSGAEESSGGFWNMFSGSGSPDSEADSNLSEEKEPAWSEEALQAMKRGKSASSSGRRADALTYFAQAVRLEPQWAEARYQLGLIQVISGYPEAAKHELKALQKLDSNLASLLENLLP